MATVWRTEEADAKLDDETSNSLGVQAAEELKAQLDHTDPEVRLNAAKAVFELLYGPPPYALDDEPDKE